MTAQKISRETERTLLHYSDKVAEYVNAGDKPNDAIVKVARANDIIPGHVQMIIQAYNNSATNSVRKSANDLLEKTASFPLADPKSIFNELYPEEVKTASAIDKVSSISDDYARRPELPKTNLHIGFEKTASTKSAQDYPCEQDKYMKRAYSLGKELEREYEERRRELSACHDKVAAAFDDLQTYFGNPIGRVSFKPAADYSVAMWGHPAQALFDKLAQDLPDHVKQASHGRIVSGDVNQEPYKTICRCLDEIERHGHLKSAMTQFVKEAIEAKHKIAEHFVPTQLPRISGSLVKAIKTANTKEAKDEDGADIGKWFQAPQTGLFNAVSEGYSGKSPERLKTDAFMNVSDPAHENKLRGLRAQSTLHNLMNTDEFLSGEDPQKVTGLYNEINKLSPHAADQPLLMRALLRRYLAMGAVDPHDVGQLSDIEGKLKLREEPGKEPIPPKYHDSLVVQPKPLGS